MPLDPQVAGNVPAAEPKKKRTWLKVIGVGTAALILLAAVGGTSDDASTPAADSSVQAGEAASTETESNTDSGSPTEDSASEFAGTVSHENTLRSAVSYLEFMAFIRQGLIDQLLSEYGEQFTLEQPTYAADQVGLSSDRIAPILQ